MILKRIDTCKSINESLYCTPETKTTLLINQLYSNRTLKNVYFWEYGV